MKLLTVSEVAKKLKLNEQTVYKYCRENEFNYSKIKGAIRIKESELERFINDNSKINNKAEPVKKDNCEVYFIHKEIINNSNNKVLDLLNEKQNLENEISDLEFEVSKLEKIVKENIRKKSRAEKWLEQLENNTRQGNQKRYKQQFETAKNILNNKEPELKEKQDKLKKLKRLLADIEKKLNKYVKLEVKNIV